MKIELRESEFVPPWQAYCSPEAYGFLSEIISVDGSVLVSREKIEKFRDHVLHGSEEHREWLINEFKSFLDGLFGKVKE